MKHLIILLVIAIWGAGCSKSSSTKGDEETPVDGLFSKEQQIRLKNLGIWSEESQKNAVSLLGTGDEVLRTITIKRVAKWKVSKALPVLLTRFRSDTSPMVRRTALSLIWQLPDHTENMTEQRITVALKALNDKDDTLFNTAFGLMNALLLDEYRDELVGLIRSASGARRRVLLAHLCKANLERKDLLFLSKEGDKKGKMPRNCVQKVLTFMKSKNRL